MRSRKSAVSCKNRKFYRPDRAMEGWKEAGILAVEPVLASMGRNARLPV